MTWRHVTSICVLALITSYAGAQQAAASGGTGRIAGRVVEGTTGQPITGAQIAIVGQAGGVISDLDGRYRTAPLPAGRYSIVARRLGMQPKQYDSVQVKSGDATIVNFALDASATQLAGVTVSAARVERATSEAGLLSMQQRAPSVSDGISAEQIARTPDSDAAGAATRVSGVAVVDNKFVVVRGLSERYSNTLLNGVEIASPEPTKKIVPLDIFPAALLDGIVVRKTATPDRPGDFSGGSVEIRTKEFPESFVWQTSVSVSGNSEMTGKHAQIPLRHGMDWFGFDNGRRDRPPLPTSEDASSLERFAESLRSEWSPLSSAVGPNVGFGLTLGNQADLGPNALGYVGSLTYSSSNDYVPERFFQFLLDPQASPARGFIYREQRATIEWGGVLNTSFKLGSNHEFGFKNLYTRNAEEQYITSQGFNIDLNGDVRGYQFAYVSRDLLQTQLTGDHVMNVLFPWRLAWSATVSRSRRDEPDNRQVTYLRGQRDTLFSLGNNSDLWFRFLDDRLATAQADLSVPIDVAFIRGALFKAGGFLRHKKRAFDASLASFNLSHDVTLPENIGALPPDKLFTPEIIGQYMTIGFPGSVAQPYDADDDVYATYGMLDLALPLNARFVGGARLEDWRLDLFDGGRDAATADSTRLTQRRNKDLLFSGNLTIALNDRMNLRFAGFQSIARPDTRELSRDLYVDVVGSCPVVGNPSLQRTLILNGDARWEWYPSPGEIVAISGFVKHFDAPIIRVVSGDNNCTFTFNNGTTAENYGGEFEVRKALLFLPSVLSNLSLSANLTYVQSRIKIDPIFGNYDPDLELEGQSPFLLNAALAYVDARAGLDVSFLFNWFTDRISRYGFRSGGGADATQGPNIVERGRGVLDAKLRKDLWRGLSLTLSARNLTGAPVKFFQDTELGRITTGNYKPGTSVSIGITYAR